MVDANLFMRMLKNKEGILKSLLGALDQTEKMETGLDKVCDSVINNPSEENLRKMLQTTMKCVKTQSGIIKMLSLIALTYVSGNHFTGDVGSVLVKLGSGEEALREIKGFK